MREYGQRYERISSKFLLTEEEQDCHERANDDQADDLRRAPREDLAAEVESEKNHEREGKKRKDTKPVNRFEAIDRLGTRIVDIQEQQ